MATPHFQISGLEKAFTTNGRSWLGQWRLPFKVKLKRKKDACMH